MTAADYGCVYSGLPVGQGTPANPAGQYNGLLGGVPTLEPEKATTKTAGVVLQPSFMPRFAVTVDYWNIELKNAIQGYGADAIITACVNQSTATVRNRAGLRTCQSKCGGVAVADAGSDSSSILPNNNGRIRTDGVDINLSYGRRMGMLGNVSASFIGTYVHKYKVDNGLTEEYDCAGLLWSGVQRLDRCQLGTDPEVAAQGAHRHADCPSASDCRFNGATLVRSVRKPWRTTRRSTAISTSSRPCTSRRRITSTWQPLTRCLDRVNLRAGVNNLFDNDPPLITTGSGSREGSNICPTGPCNGNTYPGTWDALGRLFWAGVTIDFTPVGRRRCHRRPRRLRRLRLRRHLRRKPARTDR